MNFTYSNIKASEQACYHAGSGSKLSAIIIYLLIIASVLFISPALRAEPIVKKITYSGEKPAAKIAMFNRPGGIFVSDSLSSDSLKIVSYYQKQGWLDCRLDYSYTIRGEKAFISYKIDKRNRYAIAIELMDITGAKAFIDELNGITAFYNSRPATTANIEALINDVILVYSDNGYPYCEIRLSDMQAVESSARLEITLKINPGPEVTVERLQFDGQKNLSFPFLQTYAGVKPPLKYSMKLFKQAQRRLSLAYFINDTGDFQLRYSKSPENGILIFPIKEVSPFFFDGALGYSSGDDNFYGRFDIVLTNILGVGRRLEFDWSKKDKSSRQVRAGLSEPYPLGIPFRIDLEAFQEDRDSLFVETGGSVGLFYISSEIYAYGFSIGASRVNPEAYGKDFLPVKNKQRLSLSFSADTRNYRLNPRRGDYLYMEGSFIREKTRNDENFAATTRNYRTVKIKIEKYLQIGGIATLYGGISGEGDFSRDIPFDRLFPLGGHGSLRGYDQDIFYVARSAVATCEYRVLTSGNGRAYIFTDMAVFQAAGNNSKTLYRYGSGIGIAAPVKSGLATIEIAVPYDEGFSETKLHFGIRAGF